MVAFTAFSSAMAPIALGQGLRLRANAQRRRIVRRTRRRMAHMRAFVKRRTQPALSLLSRV